MIHVPLQETARGPVPIAQPVAEHVREVQMCPAFPLACTTYFLLLFGATALGGVRRNLTLEPALMEDLGSGLAFERQLRSS